MPLGGKGGPAKRSESLRKYIPLPGRFGLGPATPRSQDVETSAEMWKVNQGTPKRWKVDKLPRHGQLNNPDQPRSSLKRDKRPGQITPLRQVRESQIAGPESLL